MCGNCIGSVFFALTHVNGQTGGQHHQGNATEGEQRRTHTTGGGQDGLRAVFQHDIQLVDGGRVNRRGTDQRVIRSVHRSKRAGCIQLAGEGCSS